MHWTARGVVLVGSLRRLTLVLRTPLQPVAHADALDDQHTVLDFHVALSLGRQPALARVDPARFQRATQGAGQSAGRGGHYVIERGGVRFECLRLSAVMLGDRVMDAE